MILKPRLPRIIALLLVSIALFEAQTPTRADTPHDWERIRLVLLTWVNGLQNGDAEVVSPVLHRSFRTRSSGGAIDKNEYLTLVANNSLGVSRVMLKYANNEEIGDSARVSPVVIYYSGGAFRSANRLTFVREGNQWKIISIIRIPELPEELTETVLPEREILHAVSISVRDSDTGEPVVARVYTADQNGEYWPPEGHMKNIDVGWRKDAGGDVKIGEKTYAYVEPEFTLPIPEGTYEIDVRRGPEYVPQTVLFDVSASEIPTFEVRLKRWSNLQAEGWYSGDTHVHFLDPSTARLELDGEDLNVVNILATKWGELITDVEHFTGGPDPLSKPGKVVYFNEETRHGFLGHLILLNLKELVYPLTWGGPAEGVPGGFDYPALAHQADKAHQQGGLVSWAHFPFPSGEVAVDIALGKVDAVDLVTWGNPMGETNSISPARIWYRFLNCGFKIPALGGTDKMLNTQVVGSVRTYVEVEGSFSYDSWLDGIRAGRTFATTGPVLMFSANGRSLGQTIEAVKGESVSVRAEVRSRLPVDRIEIVQGGEVVAVKENPTGSQDLTFETNITVDKSSWVAARAYSSELLPYQAWDVIGFDGIPLLAHTSPIYIEVNGKAPRSREDAAYLIQWVDRAIEWARTEARYETEGQREEIIALFERAKAVYQEQIEGDGE
jgi:hypothetical protein